MVGLISFRIKVFILLFTAFGSEMCFGFFFDGIRVAGSLIVGLVRWEMCLPDGNDTM